MSDTRNIRARDQPVKGAVCRRELLPRSGGHAERQLKRPAMPLEREIVNQPDNLCGDCPETKSGRADGRPASNYCCVRTNRCIDLHGVNALADIRKNEIESVGAAG